MTFSEIDIIFERIFKDLQNINITKGTEYANSEDRLGNFKRIAATLQLSPEKVCYVYLRKHLDAIEYVLLGKKELSETFESRIKDAIMYLILLNALHIEESKEYS